MVGYRIGFIGAGNMASAILNGALRHSVILPENVYLSDPYIEKTDLFRVKGVHTTVSNTEVADSVGILILAVKPQMFETVLSELKGHVEGKCVVSIAAGISVDYIKKYLPNTHVIRVMPNTPLLIGKGMTAIADAPDVPASYVDAVTELFGAAGETVVVEEEKINAVIALSGSSPAYFFRFAAAMVSEGEKMGLSPETALNLAAYTMKGSAGMLLRSGKTPKELTDQVCSPGGTTLAALSAFDDAGLDTIVAEAMQRCVKRAEELGK